MHVGSLGFSINSTQFVKVAKRVSTIAMIGSFLFILLWLIYIK